MLTIAFLERLEDELRKQHGNPKLVLSDYFDMIGGTSVGAILATQLALGETVENVKNLFSDWCPEILRRPAFWRQPQRLIPYIGKFLVPRFERATWKKTPAKAWRPATGSADLKTGLCIVTKRVDTGSPWVLTNNPRSKFWFGNDERVVANKEYRLADVVRASAAAPHYFKPHKIALPSTKKQNQACLSTVPSHPTTTQPCRCSCWRASAGTAWIGLLARIISS